MQLSFTSFKTHEKNMGGVLIDHKEHFILPQNSKNFKRPL